MSIRNSFFALAKVKWSGLDSNSHVKMQISTHRNIGWLPPSSQHRWHLAFQNMPGRGLRWRLPGICFSPSSCTSKSHHQRANLTRTHAIQTRRMFYCFLSSCHSHNNYAPNGRLLQAALLISPFIKLISHLPSRKLNSDFDCIESNQSWAVTFDYIGVPLVKTVPSWNPWHLIVSPGTEPPRDLVKPIIGYKPEMEHQLKDAELLSSPYVNPSVVCEDLDWWKIALPGAGRTMVVWGLPHSTFLLFEVDC